MGLLATNFDKLSLQRAASVTTEVMRCAGHFEGGLDVAKEVMDAPP